MEEAGERRKSGSRSIRVARCAMSGILPINDKETTIKNLHLNPELQSVAITDINT